MAAVAVAVAVAAVAVAVAVATVASTLSRLFMNGVQLKVVEHFASQTTLKPPFFFFY